MVGVGVCLVRVCAMCGCVQGVGVYRVWVCSECGCVQSVGVFRVWVCSGCGCVQSVGVCSVDKNCTGDAAGIWQCWPDAAFIVYCAVSIVHCGGALNSMYYFKLLCSLQLWCAVLQCALAVCVTSVEQCWAVYTTL